MLRKKAILFTFVTILFSGLNNPALACDPDCPPCHYWDGDSCETNDNLDLGGHSNGDCGYCQVCTDGICEEDDIIGNNNDVCDIGSPGCQTCQSGSCQDDDSECSTHPDGPWCIDDACGCITYSDCDDRQNCESSKCADCKEWDDGDAIKNPSDNALLTASDDTPDLCQTITISAAAFEDKDHWIEGPSSTQSSPDPSDSLTYESWEPGDDGEWNPDPTTSSTANWRSPKTGSQTISVTIDDTPEAEDGECVETAATTDRDDDSKDASVSVTVGLPAGCIDCPVGPPVPITPIVPVTENCDICPENENAVGAFKPTGPPWFLAADETTGLCYADGEWFSHLIAFGWPVKICYECPDAPADTVCIGEVALMSEEAACAHLAHFPNNPVQRSDRSASNYCRDATVAHEVTHLNIDWKQDSLQDEVDTFAAWFISNTIDVDCDVTSSHNCSTAITTAFINSIIAEFLERKSAALSTLAVAGEDGIEAEEAERLVYQAIRDALDAKCTTN